VRGSEKPRRGSKKPAQKTLKRKRSEKRAAANKSSSSLK